jgi:ferrous iron transport protein B
MTCHTAVEPLFAGANLLDYVLVGNPNVGKSVVFGALTGRYATVSNYPGTTVEVTSGSVRTPQGEARLIDTPGVYSLTPLSADERVTRDILLEGKPHTVIQVADTKNLARGLAITLELAELGLPTILCLNMADEARLRGISVDEVRLAELLSIPVVCTTATRGEGIDRLFSSLERSQGCRKAVVYDGEVESAVAAVEPLLPSSHLSVRGLALHFLGGGADLPSALGMPASEQAVLEQVRSAAEQKATAQGGEPLAVRINRQRAGAAQALQAQVLRRQPVQQGLGERLGRLAVHPVWGWPILAGILYLMYLFVGVLGAGELVDLLENGLFGGIINPWITGIVDALVPFALLRDFLVGEYGLITVALTYSFAIVLPIVGTFFLAFSLLEDSGYLPRLAVMLDRSFRSMGLNGKAVLPMILGLGCDTMATVSTRMLETRKERVQVTLLLALGVPCSAQLGVLMGMVGGLGLAAMAVWGGVVVATVLAVGYLAARLIPGEQSDFLLELPPMRMPALRNILVKTLARMEWYLWEVVPIFVAGTALLFVLDVSGALAALQVALAPLVVNWLGLPAEATSALLVGFLRRDYGAAGLFDLSRNGLLDPVQVLVSMVVITLFVPCVANVLMIVKEHGARTAFWVVATVFPIAILVGGLLNLVIRWGN